MIKKTLISHLQQIIYDILVSNYNIDFSNFVVDKNKDINKGELFSNVAMTTSKKVGKEIIEYAYELSVAIQNKLPYMFEKIEVVKPGYLNFFLSNEFKYNYLNYVLFMGNQYGSFFKKNINYNIEFVSANPTGYLHIGHARNAALGMTLANVWKKFGINVEKEYYINDAGNQINILGISTFLRYLELNGINVNMDGDYYKGNEIILIAQEIFNEYKDKFINIPYNENSILDEKINEFFKEYSLNRMLIFIKQDLLNLRINFDLFTSEKSIYEAGLIEKILDKLSAYTYEFENALWLKTTNFGDDKDRVLIKNNGEYTYFLPDIAYHYEKITRKPNINKIINIWGADHKSYVDRMSIALECLGFNKEIMTVLIMQMVRLTKNGEEFKMSKRTGNSLTLKDLIDTIGVEGSRWALVSQAPYAQIEIDVDKFKNQTHDNHLFYVLYAYARICQIFNKTETKLLDFNLDFELNHPKEKELINLILYYPHTIENISSTCEANKLTNYLYLIAQVFHSYYNDVKIIDESIPNSLQNQRLLLLKCIKYTLYSGLQLLDIIPKDRV